MALKIKRGKSNRAIAKELGVNEGTVRNDRKFLATPVEERPAKAVRKAKPRKVYPAYYTEDTASRDFHFRRMTKALRSWINDEHMILPDLEYVLNQVGRLLFRSKYLLRTFPVPTKTPAALFPLTRPADPEEDHMPAKLDFYAAWLARWMACCLPREQALQDQLLRETLNWARSG